MKTPSYSNVKYISSIPLILPRVKKIERESFDFAFLPFMLMHTVTPKQLFYYQ